MLMDLTSGPAPLTYSCVYFFHSFSAGRASSFPSFSNCEQHDNNVIICFPKKVHKCHLPIWRIWRIKIYGRVFFMYFFFCLWRIKEIYPWFSKPFCTNPNLTVRWLLNITCCLVVFPRCFGPPVQAGGGRVVGAVALRPEEGRQFCTRCCFPPPLFASSTLPPLRPCCLSVSTFPEVV